MKELRSFRYLFVSSNTSPIIQMLIALARLQTVQELPIANVRIAAVQRHRVQIVERSAHLHAPVV